jgi:hypothetical protein
VSRSFSPAPQSVSGLISYNQAMRHPIRVDNSRPATVTETARTLGVSKKRTDELVREVRRIIYRDAKTGQVVIRAKRSGKTAGNNRFRNASTKVHHKTSSKGSKASR